MVGVVAEKQGAAHNRTTNSHVQRKERRQAKDGGCLKSCRDVTDDLQRRYRSWWSAHVSPCHRSKTREVMRGFSPRYIVTGSKHRTRSTSSPRSHVTTASSNSASLLSLVKCGSNAWYRSAGMSSRSRSSASSAAIQQHEHTFVTTTRISPGYCLYTDKAKDTQSHTHTDTATPAARCGLTQRHPREGDTNATASASVRLL